MLLIALGLFGSSIAYAEPPKSECIWGDIVYFRVKKTGKEFALADQICRTGLEKTAHPKSVSCSIDGQTKGSASLAEWCLAHPAEIPSGADEAGGQAGPAAEGFANTLKRAWATGSCYVKKGDACVKGKQVAEGCSVGEVLSAEFFYSPNCDIAASVNAKNCWAKDDNFGQGQGPGSPSQGKSPVQLPTRGTARNQITGDGCRMGELVMRDGNVPVCKLFFISGEGEMVFSRDNQCSGQSGALTGGNIEKGVSEEKKTQARGTKYVPYSNPVGAGGVIGSVPSSIGGVPASIGSAPTGYGSTDSAQPAK
jgi:hypothetical protein